MAGRDFAAGFGRIAAIGAGIEQVLIAIVVEDDFLEPVVQIILEIDMLACRLASRTLRPAAASSWLATFARLAARFVTALVVFRSLFGFATLTVRTATAAAATTSAPAPAPWLVTLVVSAGGTILSLAAFREFDVDSFFAPRFDDLATRIRFSIGGRLFITPLALAASIAGNRRRFLGRCSIGNAVGLLVGRSKNLVPEAHAQAWRGLRFHRRFCCGRHRCHVVLRYIFESYFIFDRILADRFFTRRRTFFALTAR